MSEERTTEISLICPFCGGFVSANSDRSEVVHDMPPCQRFMDEEPDDFMASCRKRMSN